MKRWPAKPKKIKEISEDDKRVRIYGIIVAKEPADGKIVIDDGTGTIAVFFNSLELIEALENYNIKDTVVVIGWATEGGIDGEIIAKIEGYDPNRYQQVLEVWKDVASKIERSNDFSQSYEGGL